MISVLILTLNEECNLQACLDAVKWSDDVVIFDSFSTDRTVEIARANGAHVVQRKFDNERDHRTASLQVGFKNPWVFNPDADEICTPELYEEMLHVASDPQRQEVAYRCRFRNMFMGKWIKRSSIYPTWVMRLFRPDKVHFERMINLRYVADGPEGLLQAHFEHYSFNNGFNAWFEKHNKYSFHEARETLKNLESGAFSGRMLFTSNVANRRRALKELSFRMPMRPWMRFIFTYFIRGGFLDGGPGLRYCTLLSIYEYMIVLKVSEMRERALRNSQAAPSTPAPPTQSRPFAFPPRPTEPASNAALNARSERRLLSTATWTTKIRRVLWAGVEATLFRWSFHTMNGWRSFLLRCFGARVGAHCTIRRTVRVYYPWNVTMGNVCILGDDAMLYSLGKITLGDRVMVSQEAYLCAGTHDYEDPTWPLLTPPVIIGEDAWICARAFVGPGVAVGAGGILAACGVAVKNIEPWQIVGGNPAKFIKMRKFKGQSLGDAPIADKPALSA